ncbi:MAG: TusE/DsrC/DsvC family sulfur relay protein [Betaproteobacteria bacterium]|nr:TusE/DsrC/DsvC family sulfur relay protein [Betaproteobacteria bacterium]
MGGQELATDAEGYLLEADLRDETCAAIAAAEGIALTDAHWEVIRYLRDEYQTNGHSPNFRALLKGNWCTASGPGTAKALVRSGFAGACAAAWRQAHRRRPAAGPGAAALLDCPGTPDDLFAWSRHTDNHVMRSERQPDGSHAYYIQRGRSHHPIPNAVLDLTGVVCPGPIVEAKKLLGSMAPGDAEAGQQLSRHRRRHRRMGEGHGFRAAGHRGDRPRQVRVLPPQAVRSKPRRMGGAARGDAR